jgi:hypothetical protein
VNEVAGMVPVLSSLKGFVEIIVTWGKAGKKTYEIKSFGDKMAKVQAGNSGVHTAISCRHE